MMKLPDMKSVQKGTTRDHATEQWGKLEASLDTIFNQSASTLSFQFLYQISFNLVQHGHRDFALQKLTEWLQQRCTKQFTRIQEATGSVPTPTALLEAFEREWQVHRLTTKCSHDVLFALDKALEDAKRPTITACATSMFAFSAVDPLAARLRTAILEVLQDDRVNGQPAPALLLSSIANAIADCDRVRVGRGSLYNSLIEAPIVAAIKAHYAVESERVFTEQPTPAFVNFFLRHLDTERRRVETCFTHGMMPLVTTAMTEVCVASRVDGLVHKSGSGVGELVRSWRLSDLRNLHLVATLARRPTAVVEAVCATLRDDAVEGYLKDDAVVNNAVTLVERLIQTKDKCHDLSYSVFSSRVLEHAGELSSGLRGAEVEIVTSLAAPPPASAPTSPSFSVDPAALYMISKTLEEIVNHLPTIAECLALYYDAKLKSQTDDVEVEAAADHIVALVSRMKERDLFEVAYKIVLSRRLIGGKVNDDHERLLVEKLKKAYGNSMTSKIDGMFNDRRLSEDLMERFNQKLALRGAGDRLAVDVQIMVLTSGFWPAWPKLSFTLPPEVQRSADAFVMFYHSQHKGRRLEFALSQSSVDVRVNLGTRKYEVNVATMCMAVLNLFQGSEAHSIADISTALQLAPAEAARAVMTLMRPTATYSGLLCLADGSGSPMAPGGAPAPLTQHSVVRFNTDFKSKHLKVKIINVQAREGGTRGDAAASKAAREKVDEDRRYKIDAAVVRIMKSRRSMDHKSLVTTVITVLAQQFTPSSEDVKRRIEHLIEREFLARSEEQAGVYNYLA